MVKQHELGMLAHIFSLWTH